MTAKVSDYSYDHGIKGQTFLNSVLRLVAYVHTRLNSVLQLVANVQIHCSM